MARHDIAAKYIASQGDVLDGTTTDLDKSLGRYAAMSTPAQFCGG